MLTYDIRYRSNDATTGGQVSDLQDFLAVSGYLDSDPTGFAGALTIKAVKAFQNANGINPSGFVGPITRAKIKGLSCK